MKTKILIILLSFFSLSASAQQRYFEFFWKGLYGVVDVKGRETLAPSYAEKAQAIHYQSPYLVLNSKDKEAYLIHTLSGKSEVLSFLDSRLLNIGDHDYLYAYRDEESFLMNNFDLENRKLLPKKYKEVWQLGDYLIGITNKENSELRVDILSKIDIEVKKANLIANDFKYYRQANGGAVYLVTRHNTTMVYDDNLEQIVSFSDVLADFASVQDYFLHQFDISIVDSEEPTGGAMAGAAPSLPQIRLREEINDDGYATFEVLESEDNYVPIFKIKSDGKLFYSITADRHQHKFEAWARAGDDMKLQFLFHVDTNKKAVFLPQVYWFEIDLQQTKLIRPLF